MDPLPPIPIPAAQRWKEFKLKGVPLLVFGVCLLGAVQLWKSNVSTAYIVGEAEVVQATVTSPQAGSLAQLQVTRLERVRSGQVLAELLTVSPKVLEASLAVIRAEIAVMQSSLSPMVDQQRNAMAWEQLKLDLMNHRIDQASTRISLQYAEVELDRATKLYQEKLVSDDRLDEVRQNRDRFRVRLEGLAKSIDELAPRLDEINGKEGSQIHELGDRALRSSIALQEEKLRLTEAQLSPIKLLAPIDGHVTMVYRWAGENLAAGETILTIASDRSERVTAYLRQPLLIEPKRGMPVTITTRAAHKEHIESRIAEVGVRWEPITTPLRRPGQTFENGLPILVTLPSHLKVRPGELVDLTIYGSPETTAR